MSRYNLWLKRRNKRIFCCEIKRKEKKKSIRSYKMNSFYKKDEETLCLPVNFSLSENFEECIKFFQMTKKTILMHKTKKFFFNMSKIKVLTIDALMYLLAFIQNIARTSARQFFVRGNLPKEESCRKMVMESGYLNYFNNNIEFSKNPKDKIQIFSSSKSHGTDFIQLLDLINEKLYNKIYSKRLYTILGEISSNSHEHAYGSENNTNKRWYMFANVDDYFAHICILDTGKGILKTIEKKLADNFKNTDTFLIDVFKNPEKIRSVTKNSWRGRGLKSIYQAVENGIVSNLELFTNNRYLKINENETNSMKLGANLEGTLYKFDFKLWR